MKIKLDENMGAALAKIFVEAGHDVHTVVQEDLAGHRDEEIYQACLKEKRVLITLDLDFANPIRFSPLNTAGVLVLRPARPTLVQIAHVARNVLIHFKNDSPEGKLWIVEMDQIRAFDPDVKK